MVHVAGAVPVIVSVPQMYLLVVLTSNGPCPTFGVETEILKRPSFAPFPDCEYSMIPLDPETSNGGRATWISGNRSQLVEPVVSQTQLVALVVVHCAFVKNGNTISNKPGRMIFFI